MSQQINFYRYLKTPETLDKRQNKWLIAYGILLVFLVLNSVYIFIKASRVESKISHLTKQYDTELKKLNQLIAENPLLNPKDLQASLTTIQSEYEKHNKIYLYLSGKYQFSEALNALAIAISPGVWLTEITISENGRILNLKGDAVGASNLQQFLARLVKQPIFKDQNIKLEEFKKAEVNPAQKVEYITFIIGNDVAKQS